MQDRGWNPFRTDLPAWLRFRRSEVDFQRAHHKDSLRSGSSASRIMTRISTLAVVADRQTGGRRGREAGRGEVPIIITNPTNAREKKEMISCPSKVYFSLAPRVETLHSILSSSDLGKLPPSPIGPPLSQTRRQQSSRRCSPPVQLPNSIRERDDSG